MNFHPLVGLACKQKGRQTEKGSHITVVPSTPPLSLSQPPPTEKHAEEVCQPLSQLQVPLNKQYLNTKNPIFAISHADPLLIKTLGCLLVPYIKSSLRMPHLHCSVIRLQHV